MNTILSLPRTFVLILAIQASAVACIASYMGGWRLAAAMGVPTGGYLYLISITLTCTFFLLALFGIERLLEIYDEQAQARSSADRLSRLS